MIDKEFLHYFSARSMVHDNLGHEFSHIFSSILVFVIRSENEHADVNENLSFNRLKYCAVVDADMGL